MASKQDDCFEGLQYPAVNQKRSTKVTGIEHQIAFRKNLIFDSKIVCLTLFTHQVVQNYLSKAAAFQGCCTLKVFVHLHMERAKARKGFHPHDDKFVSWQVQMKIGPSVSPISNLDGLRAIYSMSPWARS